MTPDVTADVTRLGRRCRKAKPARLGQSKGSEQRTRTLALEKNPPPRDTPAQRENPVGVKVTTFPPGPRPRCLRRTLSRLKAFGRLWLQNPEALTTTTPGSGSGPGRAPPVQPEGPGRVQRQRRARLVVSVLLCDIFQLLLVDVNVVSGGNRPPAQGVSVHLEVRLSRRNRHVVRPGRDFARMSSTKQPVLLDLLRQKRCRFSASRLVTSSRRKRSAYVAVGPFQRADRRAKRHHFPTRK